MPLLSILIKPSSALCNIQCKYCFYRDVSALRECANLGLMNLETLEQLIKNALSASEGYCCFAFQGGEPMLAGLDFYRRLIELERQYNTRGIIVENTIQTNGILMDDEWAEFFAENHFLVGLSLDGPRKINDAYRVLPSGEGSFENIMRAVSCLKEHRADFNILSVISSYAAEHPEQIYRFFRKQSFRFLQFIPCLDEHPLKKSEFSLRPGQYGRFLTKMFDLWSKDFIAGQDVEIRFFTNLIQMAAGYPPEACGMCGHCTPYPVVEGDGSVYPCDFYVTDEWKLGDVSIPLTALLSSEKAAKFAAPSNITSDKCRSCEHLPLCGGGCRRWREPIVSGVPSVSSLCEDYKAFFDRCKPKIIKMARKYLSR